MKKLPIILFCLVTTLTGFAQQQIVFHKTSSSDSYNLVESDSLYFSADKSILYFRNESELLQYYCDEIDSITFIKDESKNIYIHYQETSVDITNPMSEHGVEISAEGATLVVTSTSDEKNINYILSGHTDNGMFKIYSEKDFNIILNNVAITNGNGPALNIQSGKDAGIHLLHGSTNTLTDGGSYKSTHTGSLEEDQKAVLFSEGSLSFSGDGTLNINGLAEDKHGICSDDDIKFLEGNILINSADKDGIHANDGIYFRGGNIEVSANGDGIDASEGIVDISCGVLTINNTNDDKKGIKTDSSILISGGHITLNIAGNQSKGLDSDQDIIISGGTISGTASGNVVLEEDGPGYDPSYCTLIKCDGNLNLEGGFIDFETTGEASRGISVNGDINIYNADISIVSSGNGAKYVNADGEDDAYHGACIKVDGDLSIIDGIISLSNSGSGGKGISSDTDITIGNGGSWPELSITTTGSSITITPGGGGGPGGQNEGDYDESKSMKADKSVVINSGTLIISSADDGIKAEESITINGGLVNINKSVEGVEAPIITINDGEVNIVASDDGINATYGLGGEFNDGSLLTIAGGNISIDASNGDGIDSNGDFVMSGGTVVTSGPGSEPEVGMDVNGSKEISGGFIIISSVYSHMTEGFDNTSSQYSFNVRSTQNINANTIIHAESSGGSELFTFKPIRRYSSIVISSPEIQNGQTYQIYTGGSCSGDEWHGLYTGGTYTGGNLKKTFTVSSKVSNVNF